MSVFYKAPTTITLLFFLCYMCTETEPNTSRNIPVPSTAAALIGTHAHNDYLHPIPLYEALTLGFSSIEVDVHLVDGELYVSHLPPVLLDEKQTLERLYLKPLFQLHQLYPAFFDNHQAPLTLMIDIKTEKNSTYRKIQKTLAPFTEMLCSWQNDIYRSGAVRILLSGNRPIELVQKERIRYVQIDGRIEDLGKNYSNLLMPFISDNYYKICRKQLLDNAPNKKNLERIRTVAKKTHQEGKLLRLWNIYDNEKTWKRLLEVGVDVINTDNLQGLAFFMYKNTQGITKEEKVNYSYNKLLDGVAHTIK